MRTNGMIIHVPCPNGCSTGCSIALPGIMDVLPVYPCDSNNYVTDSIPVLDYRELTAFDSWRFQAEPGPSTGKCLRCSAELEVGMDRYGVPYVTADGKLTEQSVWWHHALTRKRAKAMLAEPALLELDTTLDGRRAICRLYSKLKERDNGKTSD